MRGSGALFIALLYSILNNECCRYHGELNIYREKIWFSRQPHNTFISESESSKTSTLYYSYILHHFII